MNFDRNRPFAGGPKPAPVFTRPFRRKILAVLVAACYGTAHANPVAPTVVAGQASFSQQGKTYSITNTPNTIINWQSFSIGADEITRFIQQSASSKVLNRITGQDPSQILGALQSNGKVFLINPNGVMFGQGSRVDVNGLVASSLGISNADFLAGKNNFVAGDVAGKVSNQGTITTPAGGQIFLVAPAVENNGVISAPNGEVMLAAGRSVQLFDSADANVQVVVSAPADQAINLGQIVAQGGRVGVFGALVNQRGAINANSAVRGENGQIVLKASGTTLVEAGSSTTARGEGSGSNLNTGGDIQLLGAQVGVTGNAVVDASGAAGGGTVLVGGDYQGKNAAVQNARQTYVGKDSVIKADATGMGDGGKIIVWSDEATRMYGSLSARGGAAGGNGGFVETSGHYLDMQGAVDTRAPAGRTGKLLLDPSDVYISVNLSDANNAGMLGNNALDSATNGLFLEDASLHDSLLLTSVLDTALGSTDITVSTANSVGLNPGFIKVIGPVSWSSSHSLTLSATTDIAIKSAITASNGSLVLSAGSGDITQTAALTLKSLSATAGGSITLGAGSYSGNVSATANGGDLTVADALSTTGGSIALKAGAAGDTIITNSAGAMSASGGNITLTADKMTLGGAIAGGGTGHAVTLQPLSNSTNIALGASDSSGTLGLSESELQKISTGSDGLLQIGAFDSSHTGSLTVAANTNLSGSLGGGLLLQTSSGNLTVNNGATLSVPGVVSLQTNASGSARVTNNGTVTAGSGINLYTANATLASGSLNATSVSIDTLNAIDLGSASSTTGLMALSAADLGSIHTGNNGTLSISVNSANQSGDITISQPLALSGGLNLYTAHNINANSDVSVGGSFTLSSGAWSQVASTLPAFSAHDFSIAGGTFVRALSGDGSSTAPYLLADVYGLQGAGTLAASTWYKLGNNIDASGSSNWNSGQGFKPLGGIDYAYAGTFDGNSHSIDSLSINRSGSDNIGLFAVLGSGTIKNLSLNDATVVGRNNVGGVYGYSYGSGSVQTVHSGANVTGVFNVGGLAGTSYASITDSGASGTVTGNAGTDASNIGGLVGRNLGSIAYSSASSDVSTTGYGYAGGLVGSNAASGDSVGSIDHAFATGKVTSTGEIVGGLVGDNNGGSISVAYATGDVRGGRNVGGFAGRNTAGGSIADVYSSGGVSGNTTDGTLSHANMGGLLGDLNSGTVSNTFSNGSVNGSAFGGSGVQGMVGVAESGNLVHGYFDYQKAGVSSDALATALTTDNSKKLASFAGFSVTDQGSNQSSSTWRIYDGYTTPMLRDYLTPYTVTVSGDNVSKVYDGTAGTFGGHLSETPSGINGTLGFGSAVNAGTYGLGGLYSTVYDISFSGSSPQLTITQRPLTASVSASKVYDSHTTFDGTLNYTLSNAVASDVQGGKLGLSGSVTFADKDVGSNKAITISGASLTGAAAGNYTLAGSDVTSAGTSSITPATLTISGLSAVSRQYDTTVKAGITGGSVTGFAGDVVTLAGSGTATFDNKKVGEGKTVTVNVASFSLSGKDAGDYVLAAPTLHADITPAPLTASGVTAADKVYNLAYDSYAHAYGTGTTLSGGTLSGVLGSDKVSIAGGAASFADRNVGSNKALTTNALALTGDDAGNYYLSSLPSGLAASITPATLTISGLAAPTRQYNNTAVADLSTGTLSGVLSVVEGPVDVVTLVAGTGSFASKDVGTNKAVTLAGFSLGGASAGNYQLVLPTGLTGTITARPLSTWTGTAGTNLWSDAGNWADNIAPDGANVLAAKLNTGSGTVVFNSGDKPVTLNTLTLDGAQSLSLNGGTLNLTAWNKGDSVGSVQSGSGALIINGGTLNVSGSLTAAHLQQVSGTLAGSGELVATLYDMSGGSGGVKSQRAMTFNQSGGTVTGVDNLTVDNLAQTGGSVDIDGAMSVGSGGNVTLGTIRAQTSLAVHADEGGAVTQTGPLVSDQLSAFATNGITLNNTGNHVSAFSGSSLGVSTSNTGISLFNTVLSGELALGPLTAARGNVFVDNHGGIHTSDTVSATSGAVIFAAHSPITINNEIDGININLSASTGITLAHNSSLSAGNAISMTAGSGISMDSTTSVSAGNTIGMTAGTGIQMAGSLSVSSPSGSISATATTGGISAAAGTHIDSNGAQILLSAPQGTVVAPNGTFVGGTVPVVLDKTAADKAAADKAAADKAAADKAAADKAAADKAAADKAAADKATADKAAADKAAADKAAADKAAADKAAADKAAADKAAADKAAADKAAADKAAADKIAADKAAADKAAADKVAAQHENSAPVSQAINSTVNIINTASSSTQSGASRNALALNVPVDTGTASTGSGGPSKVDDKVPDAKKDDKKDDGSPASTLIAKKDEPAKKMYCN